MNDNSAARKDRYRSVAQLLYEAARPLKVLAALGWPGELRDQFLASGGSQLPKPEYKPVDPAPVIETVNRARALLAPGECIEDWFLSEARAIEATALMLASAGTPKFFEYSAELYGTPKKPVRFTPATPLELAESVLQSIGDLSAVNLLPAPIRDVTAQQVAESLRQGVEAHFGKAAPRIEVVEELSANALATSSAVKVRRDAMFTRRDTAQLLNHEAFIHVATAINGRAQVDLPNLGLGHPGTTRTQEGLAVFSEFVSGTLGLDRLQRLANRTQAVQMSCDGAGFIEVYRWFLERSPSPDQAFESTRRIFRGGVLEGGAPFTKDGVYIAGLLAIGNYVRAAFAARRSDVLGLFFAGKLDLGALPALAELREMGLCRPARFVPPWAQDPSWVLSYLTLNTFMARHDLSSAVAEVNDSLSHCAMVHLKIPTREN
jgi:uncharacterized protein (TIGR02421 family)